MVKQTLTEAYKFDKKRRALHVIEEGRVEEIASKISEGTNWKALDEDNPSAIVSATVTATAVFRD